MKAGRVGYCNRIRLTTKHRPLKGASIKTMKIHQRINAEHQRCPLPLLKLKQALHQADDDHIIDITTTDPASWQDMQRFCQQYKHPILINEQRQHTYYLCVKKCGA